MLYKDIQMKYGTFIEEDKVFNEDELKKFFENAIWMEIQKTIIVRLELNKEALISEHKIDQVRELQGACKEDKFFLEIPTLLLNEANIQKTEQQEEE